MKDHLPSADQNPARDLVGLSAGNWGSGLKRFISLLLLIHLAAIFVGPCAAPAPSSYWAREAESVLTPYLRAAFLKDHGYRFFAPNPGPSHLVRYELINAEGEIIHDGKFPDLAKHWPRLLYHRHFMISESLFNIGNLPQEGPPEGAPSEVRSSYEQRLRFRNLYLDSLGKYLAQTEPQATKVRLYMQEHLIPSPEEVARGLTLDDPSLYLEVQIGEYQVEGADKP